MDTLPFLLQCVENLPMNSPAKLYIIDSRHLENMFIFLNLTQYLLKLLTSTIMREYLEVHWFIQLCDEMIFTLDTIKLVK